MLATIQLTRENTNAAVRVMEEFADAARNDTLGDYSELGALTYVLEALDMKVIV